MDILGEIQTIWVYPVKSLAPQELAETRVEIEGLPHDRERALIVRSGHPREGKTYRGKEHNLLHLGAAEDRALGLAAERGVSVEIKQDAVNRFFDSGTVSLLFDAWVNEASRGLGRTLDPQRWRPNFFARAAAGFSFAEPDLTGAIVEIGTCALRVTEPIDRCVTTTYDVKSGESDPAVLRYVAQERNNRMGVYCVVERAGTVRVGDGLRLRAR